MLRRADPLRQLVRSVSANHSPECLCDDPEVQPDGPVVDVKHVHLHSLLMRRKLAAHDLPKSGKPRLDGKKFRKVRAIFLFLDLHDGSRSNKTDFAPQDAEKRRELVHAVLTEVAPDSRDAGILTQFAAFMKLLAKLGILLKHAVSVNAHRSKLQVVQVLAIGSHICASVKDRASVFQSCHECNERKYGQCD